MSTDKVYKVLTKEQYNFLDKEGLFNGAPIDIQDGYIHLSTATQVERVVGKYFKDIKPLYIVEFSDPDMLKKLKWEKASNGDLFPHLYGEPLKKELITNLEIRD